MEVLAEPIRVLLVDDHSVFRQSLRLMLERHEAFAVVGEASDGNEALAKAEQLMPDVVLLDIRMPRYDGLDALKRLREELPAIRVVMLTASEEDDDLFTAIINGAKGYIIKTADTSELVNGLLQVNRGGAVVSPSIAVRLLEEFSAMAGKGVHGQTIGTPTLTPREKEILELIGKGLSNKEIAASLCVSDATVKCHVRNLKEKLDIHNRTQAALYAVNSSRT